MGAEQVLQLLAQVDLADRSVGEAAELGEGAGEVLQPRRLRPDHLHRLAYRRVTSRPPLQCRHAETERRQRVLQLVRHAPGDGHPGAGALRLQRPAPRGGEVGLHLPQRFTQHAELVAALPLHAAGRRGRERLLTSDPSDQPTSSRIGLAISVAIPRAARTASTTRSIVSTRLTSGITVSARWFRYSHRLACTREAESSARCSDAACCSPASPERSASSSRRGRSPPPTSTRSETPAWPRSPRADTFPPRSGAGRGPGRREPAPGAGASRRVRDEAWRFRVRRCRRRESAAPPIRECAWEATQTTLSARGGASDPLQT
jgi:hypothetical protein